MKKVIYLILAIVFIILGSGLVLGAKIEIDDYNKKDKTYVETPARVVNYKVNNNGLKAIIVEYEVEGKKYRLEDDTYSSNPKKLWEYVGVKYNPDNPSEAIWTNDKSMKIVLIIGIVFAVIGIFFFVCGFKAKGILIKKKTKEKEEKEELYTSKTLDKIASESENKDILKDKDE